VTNGLSAGRIDEAGGDFRERRKNEPAAGESRMRYRKTRLPDDFPSVKDDVDIESSWTFIRGPRAKILFLNFEAGPQEFVGSHGCGGFKNGIEKPGLIENLPRLGGINGSTTNDVDASSAETTDP
jgi:hypothetical protein